MRAGVQQPRGSAGSSPARADGREAAELQLVRKEGTARGRPARPGTETSALQRCRTGMRWELRLGAAQGGDGDGGRAEGLRQRAAAHAGEAGHSRAGLLQVPSAARLRDTSSSVLPPARCALSEGWSPLLRGGRAASGARGARGRPCGERGLPCPEGAVVGNCPSSGVWRGVMVATPSGLQWSAVPATCGAVGVQNCHWGVSGWRRAPMGRGCQRGASPLSGTLWLGDAPQELQGGARPVLGLPAARGTCPRSGERRQPWGHQKALGLCPIGPGGLGRDPPPEVGPEGEFGGGLMCSWPAGEGASS